MKMYELLEKPENWTQRANARDANGRDISSYHPDAVCWCLFGAVNKCYGITPERQNVEVKLIHSLQVAPTQERRGYGSYIVWNDAKERTHQEVLDLCRELDI